MSRSAEFANDTASVAAARRFVAEALDGSSADVRERAELLVSELATNAVRHARSGFCLTVAQRDGHVRIEVRDGGAGVPRQKSPSAQETTGRGLLIVDALSEDWGVTEQLAGKGVWFSLTQG